MKPAVARQPKAVFHGVFDEDGNATAVIIPIEKYKRFIACLEEIEAWKEAELLNLFLVAQSLSLSVT